MLSNKWKLKFVQVLVLFMLTKTTRSQNVSVVLPLNKTTSWENKELYSGFITLNSSSTLQVDFENVNKNVSYIIFQVHSHLFNITLYNNTLTKSSSINGSNLGMYSSVKPKLDTFFVYNSNPDVNLRLLISVHGYTTTDPIPGGCNMEFPLPISPFMQTKYTRDYVLVDAAAAKDPSDTTCVTIDKVYVLFYKMYLPERHYDSDNYFDGISKMMTIDGINEFGEYLPESGYRMRRMLSAYPGTGAVYVAVAFSTANSSAYSVYVPTSTYACAPLDEDGCELLDDFLSQILCASLIFFGLFVCYFGHRFFKTEMFLIGLISDDFLSQILCASLIFFGLFVCYFGHRFFKTEMFLIGLISGVIVTYILITLIADLDRPALLGVSILSGICFGAIWLLFWWFYGMPLFAVMLSTLNVGFLFAAIIYFGLPGGLLALQSDLNFWTLFISVMLLTCLMLASMTVLSNILCCAILGAYATIYPMDYYFGSNLKYIVINTVRRATVPQFNKAVLSPPFEWRDALMTLLWLALAVTGFLFQHFHNRGRPPFPPPPRSVRPRMPGSYYGASEPRRRGVIIRPVAAPIQSERTPLLA